MPKHLGTRRFDPVCLVHVEHGDGDAEWYVHGFYSYAADGTYTVTLTVTDDDGATDTAERDITVSEEPPPPPEDITLTAQGYKERGRHQIDLSWSGVSGGSGWIRRAMAWTAFLGLSALPSAAQEPAPALELDRPVRLFLDCRAPFCDGEFIRREIRFLDHVVDSRDADVHVIVTARGTGAGGAEATLRFVGQDAFEGRDDVFRVSIGATATLDEGRRTLVRALSLGLMPYVAVTETAEELTVTHLPGVVDPGILEPGEVDDPWNLWVFRLGLNGSGSGQEASRDLSLSASFSADRTSENWKFNLTGSGSYSEGRFELGDSTMIRTFTRNYSARMLLVKSVGPHFSAGFRASFDQSTFSNVDVAKRFAPAVELSVFPYDESSERRFFLHYSVGARDVRYAEETIFGVTRETIWDETLSVNLEFNQTWGTLDLSLEGSHFLGDFEKHRATFEAQTDVRIARGFSIFLLGSMSKIADQVNLPSRGITDEEILLRLRELSTSFQYFGTVGISFRFGSIFSNVVNPRFG